MPRRLGVLLDDRFRPSPEGMRGENALLRFVLGLRRWFDEIVLLSRVFPEDARFEAPYPVPTEGARLAPLPPYPRIESLYTAPWRWWPAIERTLRGELPGLDAIWLNFGHPVSLRALMLSRRFPALRAFAVMRGAYARDAALRARGPRPWRWLAGRTMHAHVRAFARLARKSSLPCIAMGVGDELRALGVRMLEIPDSVLSEEDLAGAPRASPELACDLLVVGRLDPEKGVDVLLDALPELRGADGRPVTLRVVGTGECEGRLRAKAQRLGLGSRVLFDGHVPFGPELFARYASCRLLVIPSHTEGLPKTAYEAMAFGRPVVATAVGGLRQVIGRGGERGRLVPPGDARALARAVGELLADPEALQVAGSNARAFARGVTLESQVRALVEFALPELTRERV